MLNSEAQFYSVGQDPWGINWSEINTSNYRLVFDSRCEALAKEYAKSLDYASKTTGTSMGIMPHKVTYLLHNQTVVSNGVTNFAPRQVDLFTTSPQNLYPQPWPAQLAIHEMRHVVQNTKINTGFTGALSYCFGQAGTAIAMGNINPWFYEGDAVVSETALSEAGRGREPSFEMPWRAILLDSTIKQYSYQKAVHGSFRDYVPNHYHLGYLMVAWNRQKYTAAIWENALKTTGRYPFLFPFSAALKKTTGTGQTALYHETMSELKYFWQQQNLNEHFSDANPILHKTTKHYTNYNFVQPLDSNLFIAVKSGIDQLNQLVSIDKFGNEKILVLLGNKMPNQLSAANGKIVWDEIVPDIRWQNRSYSVIKMFDFRKSKLCYMTRKSKYFAPSLNSRSDTIVTIESDCYGNNSLVLLLPGEDNKILKYKYPDNSSLQMPTFSTNGQLVIITVVNKKGKALVAFDLKTLQWHRIIDESNVNISEPVCDGNYIYFRSSYSGVENIYAVNIRNKKISQVTSSKIGVFCPKICANGGKLLLSEYNSHGLMPVFYTIDSTKWILKDSVINYRLSNVLSKSLQKDELVCIDSANNDYVVRKYNSASQLINLHSWSPFYINIQDIEKGWQSVKPGLLLYSQNPLSTLVMSGGLVYKEKNVFTTIKVTYKGYFPVFNFFAETGGKAQVIPLMPNNNINQTAYTIGTQAVVPFNFSRSAWQRSVQPYFMYRYRNIYHSDASFHKNELIYTKGLNELIYGLYAYNYLALSARDIYPRFGQSISCSFNHAPAQRLWYGYRANINFSQFLPGFFKHHSMQLGAAYYLQNDPTWFSFFIDNTLQQENYFSEKLRVLSFKYHLPIFYPDWSLGNLLYFKRLRGNIGYSNYYENGISVIEPGKTRYKMVAAAALNRNYIVQQLVVDINFMHFAVPVSVGVSANYLIESKRVAFSPIFEISFNSF